ncbi:MAG: nucleoside monophosphate kinase [Simkaniaceae bacterium]|nr:nucleoside monophosphate kinase [Simkaniaceae bacterium]
MQTTQPKLRTVLLFGPPGSGKGTQGAFLEKAGGHCHLSSGDIFRTLSPDSESGKLYYRYASRGELVPDHITVGIWHGYVMGLIATNRYFPSRQLLLSDGIPRTISQADRLARHIDVCKIIVLETPSKEILLQRLGKRASSEKRFDDQSEGVWRKRIALYESETAPVLSRYPAHLISRFDAALRPLEVLRDILVDLSDLLSNQT